MADRSAAKKKTKTPASKKKQKDTLTRDILFLVIVGLCVLMPLSWCMEDLLWLKSFTEKCFGLLLYPLPFALSALSWFLLFRPFDREQVLKLTGSALIWFALSGVLALLFGEGRGGYPGALNLLLFQKLLGKAGTVVADLVLLIIGLLFVSGLRIGESIASRTAEKENQRIREAQREEHEKVLRMQKEKREQIRKNHELKHLQSRQQDVEKWIERNRELSESIEKTDRHIRENRDRFAPVTGIGDTTIQDDGTEERKGGGSFGKSEPVGPEVFLKKKTNKKTEIPKFLLDSAAGQKAEDSPKKETSPKKAASGYVVSGESSEENEPLFPVSDTSPEKVDIPGFSPVKEAGAKKKSSVPFTIRGLTGDSAGSSCSDPEKLSGKKGEPAASPSSAKEDPYRLHEDSYTRTVITPGGMILMREVGGPGSFKKGNIRKPAPSRGPAAFSTDSALFRENGESGDGDVKTGLPSRENSRCAAPGAEKPLTFSELSSIPEEQRAPRPLSAGQDTEKPAEDAENRIGETDGETASEVPEAYSAASLSPEPAAETPDPAEPAEETPDPAEPAPGTPASAEPAPELSERSELREYEFPPLELLKKGTGSSLSRSAQEAELRETADKLQRTLKTFGVGVTVTDVSCGPSVTRYELQPDTGVKVSRIVALTDDIKLNLAAADIRMEAPIPGKSAIGIEIPNKVKKSVVLRDLLESDVFQKSRSRLSFAAGRDIEGNTVVADIGRMPHVLVAGATGSGKSVCINSIIMSILYHALPTEVKLIMVDPKVVELSVYNGIPHLLMPVVTDPKKAAAALNWAVAEMEQRYQLFAKYEVRSFEGFNELVDLDSPEDDVGNPLPKMCQILIIVDELADLMMTAANDVENAICRLAQKARAAGIHLILATQRPSVDVITGLIKANIPSRIAFAVSSGTDSRTILDMTGAEKLLGAGDMLYAPAGAAKPLRVQGSFVSDQEVKAVVDFITSQGAVHGSPTDKETINLTEARSSASSSGSERDEHYAEAGRMLIEKEKVSIGLIQRTCRTGYNRSARIMDQLVADGVVGEEEGTKPRKILMTLEEFEEFLKTLGE